MNWCRFVHRRRAPPMTRHPLAALIVAALVFGACPTPSHAQEHSSSGNAVYLLYCASCHGPDGQGNGVNSRKMDPKPADLTRIAQRNGGKFSDDTVART